MLTKTMEEAQTQKEYLENLQRHDRKLRAEVKKRRDAGGPKHPDFEEKRNDNNKKE